MDFNFFNCKLNYVDFNAGELTDFKFDNSQLQEVSFSVSLLDKVKIKNSTLKKTIFIGAKAYTETYINGWLTANLTPIKDYTSFLKEIN